MCLLVLSDGREETLVIMLIIVNLSIRETEGPIVNLSLTASRDVLLLTSCWSANRISRKSKVFLLSV